MCAFHIIFVNTYQYIIVVVENFGYIPTIMLAKHIKNLDDISNFNTDSRLDLYIEIHMNCTIIVIISSCIDLNIFRTLPVYSLCRYDHNYTKLTLSSRTFDGPNRST